MNELTRAVVESFADAPSARMKEILESLVTHLHAFAADVELTEDEWFAGIDFLTRVGHITTDQRQEFVLLSDVLGLSMLVIGMNHRRPERATPSTVFGPFFVNGSPEFANGDDIAQDFSGEPCLMQGRVLNLDGDPVPGARVEIWQADDAGFYDVQYDDVDEPRGRGHLFTAEDGRFWFWSVKPEAYPIPADGPVGALLTAGARGPMRPAHMHFMVTAAGFEKLITHVFVAGDPYLETDAVFGVREALIAPFERHEPGTAPDGRTLETPFWIVSYDLVLTR